MFGNGLNKWHNQLFIFHPNNKKSIIYYNINKHFHKKITRKKYVEKRKNKNNLIVNILIMIYKI